MYAYLAGRAKQHCMFDCSYVFTHSRKTKKVGYMVQLGKQGVLFVLHYASLIEAPHKSEVCCLKQQQQKSEKHYDRFCAVPQTCPRQTNLKG